MPQQENQKELKSVLKKYLNQSASPAERDAVNSWYEGLGRENSDVPALDNSCDKRDLGNAIKNQLSKRILLPGKARLQFRYLKYAAVFLTILSTGLFIYQKYHSSKRGEQGISYKSTQHAAKEVTLSDGSVVLLNVSSELRIAGDFGAHNRNVSLKGEAFFKIAKDKRKPFIIRSGPLKTTVVGTSFNINAYPDLDRIKIAVASGKVKVSRITSKREEMLANGMTTDASLTFEKSSGKITLKTEDSRVISSWKESKLYIDNATLTEIAKQLARYYHLRVVYDPKTDNGKRYTIRFNQEPADRVMQILSMLTKIKFTYQTNQITIK